jgi:hypothetical protein
LDRLEIKLIVAEKQRQKFEKKKGKGVIKINRKGEKTIKNETKNNKWLNKKEENKCNNKIQENDPKINILTHELLVFTLFYLMLTTL